MLRHHVLFPLIRSASSGTNFMILLYNCTDGKDCTTIQYYVGFDMKDGAQLDLVNRWNSDMRFGRAYIDDEKDPRLKMDVNLDKGGVSRGNFLDNFSVWLTLLDSFKKHIGWS